METRQKNLRKKKVLSIQDTKAEINIMIKINVKIFILAHEYMSAAYLI